MKIEEISSSSSSSSSEDKIEEIKELLRKNSEKTRSNKPNSHLPKNARADRRADRAAKAEQDETDCMEEELTWEDKDILRGLGVNNLHHVSSTVSVQEMVSRAAVKVCQVLQDVENHLRDKEGRPIRDQIDFLSKHATNAVLDPRNEDAFTHSDAFKELFHVYAADVITVKEVVKNLTTNDWLEPLIAEWKRITVDFPCLEAVDELPIGAKWVPMM